MKKYTVLPVLFFLTFTLYAQSVWTGNASVGGSDDFPGESEVFRAASNSFPQGTVLRVTNPRGGAEVDVTVSGRLQTPGLFILVEKGAGDLIGLPEGQVSPVRVTPVPKSTAAETSMDENNSDTGVTGELSEDPDYNPAISISGGSEQNVKPQVTKEEETIITYSLDNGDNGEEENSEAKETIAATESKTAEETVVAAESKTAEETVAAAESKTAEETVAAAESKTDEETVVAAESKTAEETVAAAESKTAEETVVAAESKTAEETVAVVESKTAEETVAVAESKTDEETVTTDDETDDSRKIYFLMPSDLRPPEDEKISKPKSVPETDKKTAESSEIPSLPELPVYIKSSDMRYIQVGAYNSRAVLVDTARELKMKSPVYPLSLDSLTVDGTTIYKLLIGPLSPAEMGIVLKTARSTMFPDAFPYEPFND